MDLEEDIGVMVRHNYTLHNKGPWTVRNVTAIVRPITQFAFLRAVVMFGDFFKSMLKCLVSVRMAVSD